MIRALVIGGSGATGKLVISELLEKNVEVLAIVREPSSLKKNFDSYSNYREVLASISDLDVNELARHLEKCDVIISCLGHNLTFKGIFGEPRRLVSDAIGKVTNAIELLQPSKKKKIILMNTTGNSNQDIPERPPLSQRAVISILRWLLPPHVDNEQAANHLRVNVGQDHHRIDWVVVRPDSLTNEPVVTKYNIYSSPTRNAIFDSAPTSRRNVADFIASLTTNQNLWVTWKGSMPVIYNDE